MFTFLIKRNHFTAGPVPRSEISANFVSMIWISIFPAILLRIETTSVRAQETNRWLSSCMKCNKKRK